MKNKGLKRTLSVILCILFMLSLYSIPVSATTASNRQSAMIEYFQNQGAVGLSTNMEPEEVRLFGVFLSNFYLPFQTNMLDASYKEVVQDACAFLMGYSDYTSMTSENKAIVETFYKCIYNNVNTGIFDESCRLYIVPVDNVTSEVTVVNTSLDNVATLDRWLSLQNSAKMCTADKQTYFYFGDKDTYTEKFCNLALTESLFSCNSALLQTYLKEDAADNAKALYVTPFGDIINQEGVVIIPACTNPYTFSEDGLKLPINNAFSMGSYLSSRVDFNTNLSDEKKYIPYFALEKLKNRQTGSLPLLITGLYTKVSPVYLMENKVTSEAWYRGDYSDIYFPIFKKGIVPIDVDNNVKTVLNEYMQEVEGEPDNFSLVILFANGLATTQTDTKDSLIDNLLGKHAYSHVTAQLDKPIIISENVLDCVIQDIYVLPMSKNAYGSFDYTNAERVALFKAQDVTKEVISTQIRNSSAYEEDLTTYINKKESYDEYSANYISDIEMALLTSGKNIVIPRVYEVLNKIYGKEIDDVRYAVNQQLLQYQFIQATADIGAVLTQSASMVEGTHLPIANTTNLWAEIFYAYMKQTTNDKLPNISIDGVNETMINLLPEVQKDADELAKENTKLANEFLKYMKDITSSTRNDVKGNLLLSFFDSTILMQHRKILGLNSTNIGVVDNSSKIFSGFTSPVTVPNLNDLPITSYILTNYRDIYTIVLILAFVLGVVMLIAHQRTFKQVVATVLLLAFCLLLPQTFLDSVVITTNKLVNEMYSDRFNYWAIIQHQQMLQSISSAEQSSNPDAEKVAHAMISANSYYNRSNGVQLKWMAAKKTQTFTEITETANEDSTIPGLNVYKWLFTGYLKQESYSSEALATYVYRTYTSLVESAQKNWDAIKGQKGAVDEITTIEMQPVVNTRQDYGVKATDLSYRTIPLSDNTVRDAINNTELDLSANAGLNIANLDGNDAMAGFLLYSESPFYYFYCALKSSMFGESDDNVFLHNFLSNEKYKSTVNNQTKGAYIDYLDFEGLFSNVIPYMEAANKYVVAWTEKYGTDVQNVGAANDSEMIRYRVLNTVWNMYCPWVDSMQNASYAEDSIHILDETYTIEDTLNAYNYAQYRPMIFSEAQRIELGVTEDGLTEVEKRLLQVQEETYKDLRYLANYAQFDDEVLVSTAAMIATFNFNKAFTETSLSGGNTIIYPQGYELKNFSFDAFLRLILLNSTGMSVMSTSDIYEVIIDEEGIFTGIALLLVDWLNVYIVPACMTIFLIATFVLSVFFIILMIIQRPTDIIKLAWTSIIRPALLYMLVTLMYGGGLAVLMGEGLTNYVGSQGTAFVTNSPGVTLFIMAVLAVVSIVFYIKILVKLVVSSVMYGKHLVTAVVAGVTAGTKAVFGQNGFVSKATRPITNLIDNASANRRMKRAAKQGEASDEEVISSTVDTTETSTSVKDEEVETAADKKRTAQVASEMDAYSQKSADKSVESKEKAVTEKSNSKQGTQSTVKKAGEYRKTVNVTNETASNGALNTLEDTPAQQEVKTNDTTEHTDKSDFNVDNVVDDTEVAKNNKTPQRWEATTKNTADED